MRNNIFFKTIIASIIMIGCITFKSEAMNYYDLYFKKENEFVIKGEYETIENSTDIKEKYLSTVNIHICKDEEDAISHVIGSDWKKAKNLKVESDNNENKYEQKRIVYKEIYGKIIKDYSTWKQEKDIIIKIPISIEYK